MICQLISERQKELNQRLTALRAASEMDSGGQLPTAELDAINDELQFLVTLSQAWLRELEVMHGG